MILQHSNNVGFLYKPRPHGLTGISSDVIINIGSTTCTECFHFGVSNETQLVCHYPDKSYDTPEPLYPAIM